MEQELIEYLKNEILNDSDAADIGPGDDLLGSGLVDSLGVVRLAGFVEEKYGYQVPPEDFTIENFQSIALLSAYLAKNLDAPATVVVQ